jgi:hypothetical protein
MANRNPTSENAPTTLTREALDDLLNEGLARAFQAIECAVAEEIRDLLAQEQDHPITFRTRTKIEHLKH